MVVNRSIVQDKLKKYLNNEISKEEACGRAASIVMTDEYSALGQDDELLSDAIQVLWEHHHDDGEFDPHREEIEYYVRCLEGKEEYRKK